MRLFEAIVEANHQALAGDPKAGVHVGDFADELPLIALTYIDPRLNRLFPGALALPDEHFIWLRNAGNIIFSPTSYMVRSLALACAVKGGKEIAIIGHSDCMVRHIGQAELLRRFASLGVTADKLPQDLAEFFGTFTNERDNVERSAGYVRQSPLIGPNTPVHGFMIDTTTGRLEWVVNGYQIGAGLTAPSLQMPSLGAPVSGYDKLGSFTIGDLKFPDQKIGEVASHNLAIGETVKKIEEALPVAKLAPPQIPTPPPIPEKTAPRHTGSWSARVKR